MANRHLCRDGRRKAPGFAYEQMAEAVNDLDDLPRLSSPTAGSRLAVTFYECDRDGEGRLPLPCFEFPRLELQSSSLHQGESPTAGEIEPSQGELSRLRHGLFAAVPHRPSAGGSRGGMRDACPQAALLAVVDRLPTASHPGKAKKEFPVGPRRTTSQEQPSRAQAGRPDKPVKETVGRGRLPSFESSNLEKLGA